MAQWALALAAATLALSLVGCAGQIGDGEGGGEGNIAPDAAGCPTSPPAALPAGETRTVVIETAKGSITIKIEADLGPLAAGNFVALAEFLRDPYVFGKKTAELNKK